MYILYNSVKEREQSQRDRIYRLYNITMCLLFVKLAHNYVCLCNLHAVDVMQTKKLYLKKYINIQNIKTAWKQNIICFDNILIYIFSTMHFVLSSFKGQIVLKETTIDQCFYFTFKCMCITILQWIKYYSVGAWATNLLILTRRFKDWFS